MCHLSNVSVFLLLTPTNPGIPTTVLLKSTLFRSWFTNSFCISESLLRSLSFSLKYLLARMHWIKRKPTQLLSLKISILPFLLWNRFGGNPVLNWQLFLWDWLWTFFHTAVVFAWSLLESPLLIYSLFLQKAVSSPWQLLGVSLSLVLISSFLMYPCKNPFTVTLSEIFCFLKFTNPHIWSILENTLSCRLWVFTSAPSICSFWGLWSDERHAMQWAGSLQNENVGALLASYLGFQRVGHEIKHEAFQRGDLCTCAKPHAHEALTSDKQGQWQ